MLSNLRAHLSYANVMATLATFAAIGGGAIAIGGVTGKQGQIRACYDKKGPNQGEVRLLVKGKCTGQEKRITWNQKGQAGPAGEPGPAGAPGSTAEVMPTVLASDGSGSGLDADTLDGLNSTAFVPTAGGTMSGLLNLQGGVRSNAGTVAIPAYSFTSDSNTGIFSSAGNTISISAGGAVHATVTTVGLEVPTGYLTLPTINPSVPPPTDCDATAEAGRLVVSTNGLDDDPAKLYLCDNDVTGGGAIPGWIVVGAP